MAFFSKCLMKWREPKIKGMVTAKNILAAFALIVLVSIPFGFLGGHPKYDASYSLLAVVFMTLGLTGFLIQPLLPGAQVRLTDDAIIRAPFRRRQKSFYRDIEAVYFIRDCTHSWSKGSLVVNVNDNRSEGPKFTSFEVWMKNDVVVDDVIQFSSASLRKVHRFNVPDSVNVEQVLQILRHNAFIVTETQLTPA